MLKNYFLIALRDLWKSRFFSTLNILGLGISISACLLVIMLIKDAHDFDRFHPDAGQTYRVITHALRKSGGSEPYATSPYPISSTLINKSGLVKNWVPLLRRFNGELVQDNNRFQFNGLATTPAFFEIFGFTLTSGSAQDLNQSQVIFLTAPLARKLYPGTDPIGKTIQWEGHADPLRIAGVLNEFPGKTHMEFEALTSVETLLASENGNPGFDTKNFRDYYAGYHFYQLNTSADKSQVEHALNSIAAEQYEKIDLESRDKGYRFELQPLNKITPGILLSNSMGRGLPSILLQFLSLLGLIIIVSAGFNHTNISLAKAIGRAKEIGIRKITGARRIHIFNQFIVEAMLIAMISTGVGFLFLKLLIPVFSRLQFLSLVDVSLKLNESLYIWYFIFALFVGIIIGVLPAFMISKIDALKSMQKLNGVRILKHLSLRKVIIVGQLSITLVFFFLTTVSFKQVQYSLRTNFAADRDYTVNLDLQGVDFQKAKNELSRLKEVSTISGSSMRMGTYRDSYVDVKMTDSAEAIGVRDYVIDENFARDFNIQVIHGESFTADPGQVRERGVMVNESFLRFFNLGNPAEAIGKGVYIDTNLLAIAGIVRDFRFKPAEYAVEPLLLRYIPSELNVMHINLNRNSNVDQAIAGIKSTWSALDPVRTIQWSFYSDDIKALYDSFKDMIWVISFFAILAGIISLMGLLGMVAYNLVSKRKEIAIRKVVGATLNTIYWTLSRSYIKWMAMAILISIPLATLLITAWLRMFAFRISWTLDWFLPGFLTLGSCVLIVVSFQVIRAAISNPVFSLRNE